MSIFFGRLCRETVGTTTFDTLMVHTGRVDDMVSRGRCTPVNDLSRGCLMTDIVNTVAITAIQAQVADQQHSARWRRRATPVILFSLQEV